MATIVIVSIVGAVGARHGFPLIAWGVLEPTLVLKGQLWRLFTWVFFETDPISLVFSCAMLYWFGRDLAYRWGPTRFVLYYMGLATAIGLATVGLSRLYAPLAEFAWAGSGPLQAAFAIFWATYYPTRQLNLFVAAIAGRNLVLLVIGGTVLFALFGGIEHFIPHFLAEGLTLALLSLPSPTTFWLERKLHNMEKQRRASHLKIVPRDGDRPRDKEAAPGKDHPPGGRWLN
jgi:membrane associated rhomboid family serine protease